MEMLTKLGIFALGLVLATLSYLMVTKLLWKRENRLDTLYNERAWPIAVHGGDVEFEQELAKWRGEWRTALLQVRSRRQVLQHLPTR